jgi:hypothetical protein
VGVEQKSSAHCRTVAIEYRWAEAPRFDEIVNDFARLKVDVMLPQELHRFLT